MRVLMVTRTTPHLPTHDRARLVPAHLLAHLAGHHEIALVAVQAAGDTPAQRGWAASVATAVTHVPATRRRLPLPSARGEALAPVRAAALQAIAEWTPDVVHLEGTPLAPLAGALPVPSVVACRESGVRRAREARRLARTPREWMRAQIDERLETEWERRWLPAAQACIAGSEDDRRVLAERVPAQRIDVIPVGVDETRYDFRRSAEAARLIFAGNLARPAHREAARRLATRVLPRVRRAVPPAELLVIGGGPEAALRGLAELPGVRVAGATSDLRPSLWSAAATLVPAEAGPAVEAAILEAMALGTPVVAAPRTLGGLDHVLPGYHLLGADTDAELAEAALLVLREPVVASTLATNARQLVERRYTWAALARAYTSLWARAADAAPATVAA
jgi:glycosyltransferase involved in cell wall biosynthesis